MSKLGTVRWARHIWIALVLWSIVAATPLVSAARTVRVGVYQNKPKVFIDENGRASGFLIELLKEIAAREQWSLVYQPCEWAECLIALEEGRIDLMPDVAYSLERDQKYDFHKTPVVESWSQVYANPRVEVSGLRDLEHHRVAVLQGSIQQTVLEQYMRGFGFEVTLVPTDSLEQAFKHARDGTADAAAANHFFGDYFYREYGLVKTPIVFNAVTLFYATAQGRNSDLLQAIDQHLEAWIQEPNSVYYATLNRWLDKPPLYHVPQYVGWVIGLTSALLVLAIGMILLLRAQVRVRTRHLEQANAALRESEMRYQLISTVTSDYMFSTHLTAEGKLVLNWVAGAFEAITGYTFEEYVARGGWRAALHPDDLATDDRDLEKLRANQQVISEVRTITKQGQIVWVRVYAHPVLDARGELVGIYGAVQDITEQKRAEEDLRRRVQELEALYHASLSFSRAQDVEAVCEQVLRYLEQMLDYERGAIVLRDETTGALRLLAHAHVGLEDAAYQKELARVRELLQLPAGITRWVAEHGEPIRTGDVRHDPRYVEADPLIQSEMAVPLRLGTRVIGALNVESYQPQAFSDADERLLTTLANVAAVAIENASLLEQIRRANLELERRVAERTAQLQSANKELEAFSYSVSHDLRAPLRAISGFAEIIARRHRAHLNDEGQHYVDNIVQASARMGQMIDDLLKYSRLGRAGVRRDVIALREVFALLANDLAARLQAIGGTLDIPENLPTVLGDRTLLLQIFANLLENAITYRKPDTLAQIQVGWQSEGDSVIIRVRDNGIGIAPEHHEKIFNVFQRLHNDEEYPGTGIGLATVKKAVELLGGRVWVESQIDQGSTFFVQLPKE